MIRLQPAKNPFRPAAADRLRSGPLLQGVSGLFAVGLLAALLGGCTSLSRKVAAASGRGQRVAYFNREVKPVLERNCLRCHNGTVLPAALNLCSSTTAFSSYHGGRPYIIPGKPDESRLIAAVSRVGTHPLLMPRQPISLTDDQIGMLREWVEDGAVWPDGNAGQLQAVPNPEGF